MVRQGRALRVAGGAGGELDVDRVVELQALAQLGQRLGLVALGLAQQVGEVEHAGAAPGTQADHDLEGRQAVAAQQAGFAVGQLGRQVGEHRQIVAALEGRRQDQRAAAHLVEGVFELAAAVGRVDVDQHQPGLGGGELGERPFVVVLRPDADPVAGLEAQPAQATGQRVHLEAQLGVGQADVLVAHHQRLASGIAGAGVVEIAADGLADQGFVRCAMDVAQRIAHRSCLLTL